MAFLMNGTILYFLMSVPRQPDIKVKASKLVSGQKGTCYCNSPWGHHSVELRCFGTENTSKQNGGDVELEFTATPMLNQRTCVCTFTDMFANKIRQRSITLDISYGPQNVTVTPKIDLIEGQSTHLNCQVDSNPPSNIIWTREGRNMSANSLKYSVNRLQLTITSVGLHDAGMYTCEATNIYGEANGTVMITVQVQATSFLLSVGVPMAVFCMLFFLLLFAYIFFFKQHFRPINSTKELADKTGSLNKMGHIQKSMSSTHFWQQVDSVTQDYDDVDVGSQDVMEQDGIVYTMVTCRDSTLLPSRAKESIECTAGDTIYAQPVLHTSQECVYENI
uniref:sialic acid-binding Ig-like lectin 12 isoform X2 n=1 Tax=Myxine glutinosa TaxID=7769 RepID=UPI00358DE566